MPHTPRSPSAKPLAKPLARVLAGLGLVTLAAWLVVAFIACRHAGWV